MANHTAGQLKFEHVTGVEDMSVLLSETRDTIAEIFEQHHTGSGIGNANGARLVACWNACIGIPTEMLESTEHGEKPALVTALATQVAQLRGELKVLEQRLVQS